MKFGIFPIYRPRDPCQFRKNPENSGRVSRPGRDAGRPDPVGKPPSGHLKAATRPPSGPEQRRRSPCHVLRPRRSTESRISTCLNSVIFHPFAGADSGHLRPRNLSGFAPLLPSNLSMVVDHQDNHRTRRIQGWKILATVGFRAEFRPIRPSSDFEVVTKLDPCVVVYMPVKFGDHRRWLIRRRVGLTRSHFGRRVAARPPSAGAVLCSDMLSSSIRTTFVFMSF